MIAIRPMADGDIEAVSCLEERTFSMPWSADAFREMLRNEDAVYYVAEEDGVIVGCCGARNILGEGEITNVMVEESRRDAGIGTKLVGRVMEEGRLLGIEAYTLEVRAGNSRAIHVYEKLGFAVEGRRRNFYEKPREDALIMWKR